MKQLNPNLTEEQKAVLFDKATERPFSGELLNVHDDGTFSCANCGTKLFDAQYKFDSGSGWPSFDRAIPGSVKFVTDDTHGMVRNEVACATCGAHLGHAFADGPSETTGDRYCINSLALDFDKAD